MSGIKNLEAAAEFIIDIALGVEASLKDGKVTLSDAFEFKNALFNALPAFKGLSELDDEYFDLNDAEAEELKHFISQKLALAPNHASIEGISEIVLNLVIESHNLIASLVESKNPA